MDGGKWEEYVFGEVRLGSQETVTAQYRTYVSRYM